MRIVKFITVAVLLACFLLSVSFFTAAETKWSADLKLELTSPISDDGTFSVRASVSDITSKDGIVCAIYHVHFDPTVLKLVSWTNAHPAGWDFSEDSSFGAEDWTDLLQDENGNAYLMYTIMNTSLENGIKNDGILYTDLVFKVISDDVKTTDIHVTDISFMDKNLVDDCLLTDRQLELTLVSEESSSAESSEVSSRQPEESSKLSEESSKQVEISSKQPEESSLSVTSSEVEEPSDIELSIPQESSEQEEPSVSFESNEPDESVFVPASSADESVMESFDESEESMIEDSENESTVTSSEDVDSDETTVSDTSNNGERVVMTVLLQDIKDQYGVSALQFKLKYKPTLLEFVDYEIILPDNWDLGTEYTEDLCNVSTNGDLMFCVMNYELGCGVMEDGILGFRIVFETKNVSFDPSLITMSDIQLINDNLSEVSQEDYNLAVSYEGENGSLTDDSFVSNQDEGKTLKIVIAVIACVILASIAISAFVFIRKKKQA